MHEEMIQKIKDAGVVGAGGAGFPTHVKVNASAEHVIVNGAECEPLLRVDQQLMAVMADRLVKGLEAVMQTTGASLGTIALKGKYHDAIEALEKAIAGKPIKLFILGDFYPAGDEHVTVYEVVGKIIPEGGIPLKVGCVVDNVETLINVADALEGCPVTDTYLTVTGEVPNPITVKLPIGTTVAEALALAGQTDMRGKLVVEGGPMMGKVIDDFSQPITKTTKGLIVLAEDHPMMKKRNISMAHIIKQAKAACIQCMRCTDMCPRHMLGHRLSPHRIMRGLNYFDGDQEVMKMAFSCTECGACEYACDMMLLSPRRVNALLKQELGKKGMKATPPSKPEVVVPSREYMKIPVKRLISSLGLTPYNVAAPLVDTDYAPKKVTIPLKQHIGAPAQAVVTVGQHVERGALIGAIPEGAMGASVHASIRGTVREVSQNIVIEADGDGGGKQ
ncbi:4Fe-4S dicluster domain-containing protein [Candidatus Formimonas warabiya]|uniref:NADH dehydrogenase n=1 Tax=Formimonas warabiya TaxID=1761012 RepID=A0A3G1KS90_FORW1|nr:4Fe-4S dicluster domain-containing protein [Candidatus Formimonas warabiya]ATW25316.1 NADH dehydrogenase [Candidatus Formimonas warabiya]